MPGGARDPPAIARHERADRDRYPVSFSFMHQNGLIKLYINFKISALEDIQRRSGI
jgi:hypothetical protein